MCDESQNNHSSGNFVCQLGRAEDGAFNECSLYAHFDKHKNHINVNINNHTAEKFYE